MTPKRAGFFAGQLRWSNRAVGLEIAPLTSETGEDARRGRRRRPGAQEFGLLLQDELEREGYEEGCGVVVIVMPRAMADLEIMAARDRIRSAVAHDAEVNGG